MSKPTRPPPAEKITTAEPAEPSPVTRMRFEPYAGKLLLTVAAEGMAEPLRVSLKTDAAATVLTGLIVAGCQAVRAGETDAFISLDARPTTVGTCGPEGAELVRLRFAMNAVGGAPGLGALSFTMLPEDAISLADALTQVATKIIQARKPH